MRTNSIRNPVVISLLGAIGVLWLGAIATSYVDAHRELDQLFDAHLAQSAQLLSRQAGHELLELDDLEDEELADYAAQFAVQLWSPDGELLLRMGAAPRTKFSAVERGFSDVVVEGREWRVFSEWDTKHLILVQMAEPHEARQRLAVQIAVNGLTPLALALPLMGALIWWIVSQGLRPVRRMSEDVARREAANLEPLEVASLPSEIRPLAVRLNELLQRIERSLANEKRFTSDAAHELRNPTAAIRAQAEAALSAGDVATMKDGLSKIVLSASRLARLVDQLLALARLDASTAAPQLVALDLVQLTRRTLAEIAPGVMDRAVTIDLDAPERAMVRGDPALLEVVVRNLIDNAAGHGGAGTHITARIVARDDSCDLIVTDDGPGVSPGLLTQLGRRFFRAPERPTEGSGLGLSIVHRVVELLGASIRYEPGPTGRGLSAVITLAASR
jgi:two-component system, OmpR family, sensor histidine kinase QseC